MSVTLQQARIDHINAAEKGNHTYFRRVRITDYLPGQATYNLGDYPTRISAAPTDYDRMMIKTSGRQRRGASSAS